MVELLLNAFASVSLLILSVLVVLKKDRSALDWILFALAFDQFLFLLDNVFIVTGWIHHFPYLLFLSYIAAQVNPPLILLYADMMIGRKKERFHPLHAFSGFTVLATLYFGFTFLQGGLSDRVSFLGRLTGRDYPWQMSVLNYALVATPFCYLLVAIIREHRFLRAIEAAPSIDTVPIRSSRNNNILIFVINLATAFLYAILPMPLVVYLVMPLGICIMYLAFIFSVFRRSVVFSSVKNDVRHLVLSSNGGRKQADGHATLHLKPEQVEDYTSRIIRFIRDDKAFVDPDLTLEKLAHQLKIPKHHLSFVINSELKKGFFDLINSYRVEEAKKLLRDGEARSVSIDSVCYDVGFNSKSAFYRSFKKITGQTPAQFAGSPPSDRA